MARINVDAFKQYNKGEVVTADEFNKVTRTTTVAVNDIEDKLDRKNLEVANINQVDLEQGNQINILNERTLRQEETVQIVRENSDYRHQIYTTNDTVHGQRLDSSEVRQNNLDEQFTGVRERMTIVEREVDSIRDSVSSGVVDDSVMDKHLSSRPGMIKERVATNTSDIQTLKTDKLGKTEQASDSARLGGSTPSSAVTGGTIVKRESSGLIATVGIKICNPDGTHTSSLDNRVGDGNPIWWNRLTAKNSVIHNTENLPYEVGNWTPHLAGSTSGTVTSYKNQTGRYVRVGNMVTVTMLLTATGSVIQGNVIIQGLPFPVNSHSCASIANMSGIFTSMPGAQLGAYSRTGESQLNLCVWEQSSGTKFGLITHNNIVQNPTFDVVITMSYRTN